MGPENVHLSAFCKKPGGKFELRVIEVEGKDAAASVDLSLPVSSAAATSLLGKKTGEVSHAGGAQTLEDWESGSKFVTTKDHLSPKRAVSGKCNDRRQSTRGRRGGHPFLCPYPSV